MATRYLENYFTPEVTAAQYQFYGRSNLLPKHTGVDPIGPSESAFIYQRDSFYMATVTSGDQWPYLQHRGGKPGFLRVINQNLIGFADYKGNRQMISTGNLSSNDRVALFLMDYPSRERLKIMGHGQVKDARNHPKLVEELVDEPDRRFVERIFLIDIVSFDWNCPKYIMPRYTREEVDQLTNPLKQEISDLKEKLSQRNR